MGKQKDKIYHMILLHRPQYFYLDCLSVKQINYLSWTFDVYL
jgi:hypothetical protein